MDSLSGNKYLCVHAHFYQPPRENPWLETVELEDSASPYHDWNERIAAECYAPNTAARVLDGNGLVMHLINNYQYISFNIGPTLLTWMERNASDVLHAICEAEKLSCKLRGGHSNALAQPYAHTILPLDGDREKRINVRWGLRAYSRFFHHRPEGMWLPETAVDIPTLEALAAEGILFTILAPHQAKRIRPLGSSQWTEVSGSIEITRAYLCKLPSGRNITVFFYHDSISRAVAFEGLLNDGEAFYKRLISAFTPDDSRGQLVHIATDGESYGHHHRFGEMALAYVIYRAERDPSVQLTNYGEFLELSKTQWEVEIRENTSWSCIHGIERWRSDCGCKTAANQWHQRWRGPLRDALWWLQRRVDLIFESQGARIFRDPWEALDDYGAVILEGPGEATRDFWEAHKRPEAGPSEMSRGLALMEMKRHSLLMFTSCGWFFDDISGIEAVLVLKHAARAIQLARMFGPELENEFVSLLEKAPSNLPSVGNGRGVWDKRVRPVVVEPGRAVAHYAMGLLLGTREGPMEFPALEVKGRDTKWYWVGNSRLLLGRAGVSETRIKKESEHVFGAIHFGGLDVACFQRPFVSEREWQELAKGPPQGADVVSGGDAYLWLRERIAPEVYRLRDLFEDERRRVVTALVRDRIEDYLQTMDSLAEPDLPMLEQLASLGFPVPEPLVAAASVHVDLKVQGILERLDVDPQVLEETRDLVHRCGSWGYRPKGETWGEILRRRLEECLVALETEEEDPEVLIQRSRNIIRTSRLLGLSLNFWKAQNLLIRACRRRWYSMAQALEEAEELALDMGLRKDLLPWNQRLEAQVPY